MRVNIKRFILYLQFAYFSYNNIAYFKKNFNRKHAPGQVDYWRFGGRRQKFFLL